MVAAVFMHHTSRNQDPNLHSHAVVANATQRDNGAWVSVQSRELFRHKMLLGQIYRSALAREATRLGYDVVRTDRDGRFELAAVDAADLRQWSSPACRDRTQTRAVGSRLAAGGGPRRAGDALPQTQQKHHRIC